MILAREPRCDYHSYEMTNATVFLGEPVDYNHSDVDSCRRIVAVGLELDELSEREVPWVLEDSLNVVC